MTAPPRGSLCTSFRVRASSNRIDRSVHKPTAASDEPRGGASSSTIASDEPEKPDEPSARQATSWAVVTVVTARHLPPTASRRCSCWPELARSTRLPSTAAIEIALSGCHMSSRVRPTPSMRRTPPAVTCTMAVSPRGAQQTVALSPSKPSGSTSPSSSSCVSSTRVSEMNESTRYVLPATRADQSPLMPGSSMRASSLMPMPLRTMRSEPSLLAPEHVTSCPWPCLSKSTTTKSTIGPRLDHRWIS
mmetsp:Transcript_636/g.1319  ORF Transcript_636/g.1319 Transcript_636/m.1319 type:complete len:247 (-) Transcript_636:859-1599(-)